MLQPVSRATGSRVNVATRTATAARPIQDQNRAISKFNGRCAPSPVFACFRRDTRPVCGRVYGIGRRACRSLGLVKTRFASGKRIIKFFWDESPDAMMRCVGIPFSAIQVAAPNN